MKRSHLLAISLLSLFSFSCDKEETVQPEESVYDSTTLSAEGTSAIVTSIDSHRKNLMVEEGFESPFSRLLRESKYEQFQYYGNQNRIFYNPAYSHAFNQGEKYVREGRKAARFELKRSDKNTYRSELMNNGLSSGRDRWYGLSINLPKEYWRRSSSWDIITQFWAQPDPGEKNRNPPIALYVSKGRLKLGVRYASKAINTDLTKDGYRDWDLGPVETSKWIDLVFHINYSYKSDGVLELWKDGVKVVSYKGPNSYNDRQVPYFKCGIYRRNWNDVATRAIYVDEVRVGNALATYKDVAPSSETLSAN